jgi:hypothetical protein
MRRIHSTAIASASILSVAALSSTLSAQYEKAKPRPARPQQKPNVTIPQ